MARYFNKTITTPEEQALYDRIQECKAKREELYAKQNAAYEECKYEFYWQCRISPFQEQIDDLRCQIKELEEQLCIALWGYGTEAFSVVNAIESLEKDIAKRMLDIKRLNAQIEECKKDLKKIGVEV